MKINFQKLVSVLLSVCMLLSMCSFAIFADEPVSHVEYFVKATATAGGNGTLASPFNTLAAAVNAVKSAITADKGTATLYILPTGDEKVAHNPYNPATEKGTYLDYSTIHGASFNHQNITITYASYNKEYEGAELNGLTEDYRGSIANTLSGSFYATHTPFSGPTIFKDIVWLDMRQQGAADFFCNNYDVVFTDEFEIFTANGDGSGQNKYNADIKDGETGAAADGVDERSLNQSNFVQRDRGIYIGGHSGMTTNFNSTTKMARVVFDLDRSNNMDNLYMSSSNVSYLPGMTYVLPYTLGSYSIEHIYVGTALTADSKFEGPINLVLNGTSLSLFRPNSGDTLELTSANVPEGLQIIKNNGGNIINMSKKFTCDIYNITVENIEGFALDVTDKTGTYTVKGGAGIAYVAAGSKIYYSVNGKITVPDAGEYTVRTAATLDAVKAAVDPEASWNDNGNGTLTKSASAIYFVKPGATNGNGSESAPYGTLQEVVSAIKSDHKDELIGDKATVKIMRHGSEKASGLWNNSYDRSYYLDYRTLNSKEFAHPEVTITYTSYESNEDADPNKEGFQDPDYVKDNRGRIAFGFGSSKYIHMLIAGPTKFENIILLDFRNAGYNNIIANSHDVTFGTNVDIYRTANTSDSTIDTSRTDVDAGLSEQPTYFGKWDTMFVIGGSYETYTTTIGTKPSKVVFKEIPTDGLATSGGAYFTIGAAQTGGGYSNFAKLQGTTVYLPDGTVSNMNIFNTVAGTLETVVSGPYNVVLNGTKVNKLFSESTVTAEMLPDGLQIIKNNGATIGTNTVVGTTAPYYELTTNGVTLDVTDTVGTYSVTGGQGIAYAVSASGKYIYYQTGAALTVPAGTYTVNSAATIEDIKNAINPTLTWIDNGAGMLTRGSSEKTFYVTKTSTSATQDGTEANPFKNVKSAVDYANTLGLIAGDVVNLIINDTYKATQNDQESTTGYTAWATSGGQMTPHVYTLVIEGKGQGDNGTFLATEENKVPCYQSIYLGGPTVFRNINLLMKRHNVDTTWGTSGYDATFENVTFYYSSEYADSKYLPLTAGRVGNIAFCAPSANSPMGPGGHIVFRNVNNINKIMTGTAAPTYTGDVTLEFDGVKNADNSAIGIVFGGYRGGQTNSDGTYVGLPDADPYNGDYVTNFNGDLTIIVDGADVYARCWDPQWSFKYCGPVNIKGNLNVIAKNGSDVSGFINTDKNVPNGADASKVRDFAVAGSKYYLSLTGETDVTISEDGIATTQNGYFYTASADGNTVNYTKTYTLASTGTLCYANAAPSFAALMENAAANTTAPLGQVFDRWIVDEANSTLTATFYSKDYDTYFVKFGVTAGQVITYGGKTGKAYPTVVDAVAAINAEGKYTAADAVPVIVLEDDTDITTLPGYAEGNDKNYWFYTEDGRYIKGTRSEDVNGFWTDANGVAGGVYGRLTAYSRANSTPAQNHAWTLLLTAADGAATKPYLAYTNRYGENSVIQISGPTVFRNIAIVANRSVDREVSTNGYDVTFDGVTFNYLATEQFSNAIYNGGIAAGHPSVMLQKNAGSAVSDGPGGTVKFVGVKFSSASGVETSHSIYAVRNTGSVSGTNGDFEEKATFIFKDTLDHTWFSWSSANKTSVDVKFNKGLELIAEGAGTVVNTWYRTSDKDYDPVNVVGGALVVMKDGATVNAYSNSSGSYQKVSETEAIPSGLSADKKWIISVEDYNVNLTGDGNLITDAPYSYYVAFVNGKYDAYIGKINNGIISDLPSGMYKLEFVNTNPVENNFADMRPMVTDDVNKQQAGSWTQKVGTNLYVAKGFASKYVVKQPAARVEDLWFENDNSIYTLTELETFMGNQVSSFKAHTDGSTAVQPNIAYSAKPLKTFDGQSIPAASVRYVTVKYFYKTVEGGGKLEGEKFYQFQAGRFSDPATNSYVKNPYDSSADWCGGNGTTSLNTIVGDQWATVTFDLWNITNWDGKPIYNDVITKNPTALIGDLRLRPFNQTAGKPGLAVGEELYIADFIFTDYNPMTSYDTFYVSSKGTANGNGATLETALNTFEAVYELADASGFAEVDVYIDGTVAAGTPAKNEYTGITLNIIPLNGSGDTITELDAVADINLGAVTVNKLNLISGSTTNNAATIGTVVVDDVKAAQFNQMGGSVSAIAQNAGATPEKVVFFVSAESTLPSTAAVNAEELIIVRAPLMKDYKRTVGFPVTPTKEVGVFDTYSGAAYQFGWGLIPYTCYVQNDDVIFYSNVNTDYKLTIDEPGDYQLMVVGTESNHPSASFKATYYFTTKTLNRDGKGWKETATVPGVTNDFYGNRIVLFPLSPDALAWNADNGTGKITAVVAENYSFDGVTYTAKKAHTVNFSDFVEPVIPEGTYFKGWMNADSTYAAGTVTLAAGDVLTAQFAEYDLAVGMDISVTGAQIRLKDGAQDLRFVSKISKALLNSFGITEYEGENVKFGTVLLPYQYLSKNEYGIGYVDPANSNAAAKVPAVKKFASDDTSVTFTAVLTKLTQNNMFMDYVARPYIEYVDENGVARVVYGDSYDTSIWEIADFAIRQDENGKIPVSESAKATLTDIRDAIETYIDAPVGGKVVRRVSGSGHSEVPLFQTTGTGRHTDVHLASGNYADVTDDQFAQGKVFYNTNFGTVIREVHIAGGTAKTEIGILTDTHYEVIDYNGLDKYDPEYMFTAQTRQSWSTARVDNSTINAAKIAGGMYDKMIFTGDIIDYTAYASLELFDKEVASKYDNGIYIVGNHDAVMNVGSTTLSNAFSTDLYKETLNKYWVNDPDDLDGDGDLNELYYYSEVVNGVILVNIDNGAKLEYSAEQLENFKKDLALAREKGYIILMFQHIPIATGDPEDAELHPVERFGDKWNGTRNYANLNTSYSTAGSMYNFSYNMSSPNDAVNDEMYTLITNNSDIIRGLFTGHLHQSEYCELLPRDAQGNVYPSEIVNGKKVHYYLNGEEKVYVPTIPQFGMASTNYTDYSNNNGKPEHGTMLKIVIDPAN